MRRKRAHPEVPLAFSSAGLHTTLSWHLRGLRKGQATSPRGAPDCPGPQPAGVVAGGSGARESTPQCKLPPSAPGYPSLFPRYLLALFSGCSACH